MQGKPIRVLVVDDSSLVRRIITRNLGKDPEIEVIDTASNPFEAKDKILTLKPDVVTLDIEMPRMDGLTFLSLIMKHRPMPVIMVSSLTQAGSDKATEALQRGAVDVLGKPAGSHSAFEDGTLARKIKAAAAARMDRLLSQVDTEIKPVAPVQSRGGIKIPSRKLVVIGSSTGGTEALRHIVARLPAEIPGTCIVQHIQSGFSASLARRLNDLGAPEVTEARDGDPVQPGRILVAPGDSHLTVRWDSNEYRAHLSSGPPIHYQRPAVEALFESAARSGAGGNCLGIILTGMGADGAKGMLSLKNAGAMTVAQDEATSVVYGMPKEAMQLGAVRKELPLQRMADVITRFAESKRQETTSAALAA